MTMTDFDFSRDFGKAMMILSADWPAERMDAPFIHAVSRDATGDSQSAESDFFLFAGELFKTNRIGAVVINGSLGERFGRNIPGENWEGATGWKKRLVAAGIPEPAIVLAGPGHNTKQENLNFLTVARQCGWKRVGVLSVNYHLPRAFMGYVKAMEEIGWWTDLFAFSFRRVDWFSTMTGSQGIATMPTLELAEAELAPNRLPAYLVKGDLCSFEELFNYLSNRKK